MTLLEAGKKIRKSLDELYEQDWFKKQQEEFWNTPGRRLELNEAQENIIRKYYGKDRQSN